MSDDIEKARAAHAALVAAKEACEAAGFKIHADGLHGDDALAQCIGLATSLIDARVRQSVPIAFGDNVTVRAMWRRDATSTYPVSRVGRTLVYLGAAMSERAFRLDTGRENGDPSNYHIDADDLARIKRDLVGKRPPKPAPTLRDVGAVTTATKGDDE